MLATLKINNEINQNTWFEDIQSPDMPHDWEEFADVAFTLPSFKFLLSPEEELILNDIQNGKTEISKPKQIEVKTFMTVEKVIITVVPSFSSICSSMGSSIESKKKKRSLESTEKTPTKKNKIKNKKNEKGWNMVLRQVKTPSSKTSSSKTTNQKKYYDSSPKRFINTTLILKNLPFHRTREEDIEKVFSKFGEIMYINVLRNEDGSCTGKAFIRFVNKSSSDQALKMNGKVYNHRPVYVEYARVRQIKK